MHHDSSSAFTTTSIRLVRWAGLSGYLWAIPWRLVRLDIPAGLPWSQPIAEEASARNGGCPQARCLCPSPSWILVNYEEWDSYSWVETTWKWTGQSFILIDYTLTWSCEGVEKRDPLRNVIKCQWLNTTDPPFNMHILSPLAIYGPTGNYYIHLWIFQLL